MLELREVTKRYPGNKTSQFGPVTLNIAAGEFVAVIGPSGAGKSTLLNILGLLDVPTSGSYLVSGSDTAAIQEQERDALRGNTFGFVFQDAHVLAAESVASNAATALRIARVAPPHRPEIVAKALDAVALAHKYSARAGNLSGGERSRLALARAIAGGTQVLLADEPTGALDSETTKQVLELLAKLVASGVTVVVVTHDPLVANAANRVITISDGKIVSDEQKSQVNVAANDLSEPVAERADELPVYTAAPGKTTDKDVSISPRLKTSGTQGTFSYLVEKFYTALSNLTIYTRRSLLMFLAFAVGTCGLVVSAGLSESAAAQVVNGIEAAGNENLLFVTNATGDRVRAELGLEQNVSEIVVGNTIAERLRQIPAASRVGVVVPGEPLSSFSFVSPGTSNKGGAGAQVLVVDAGYLSLAEVKLRGKHSSSFTRLFASLPSATSAGAADNNAVAAAVADEGGGEKLATVPSAIITADFAKKLGIASPAAGRTLWLGVKPLALLGVLESTSDDQHSDVDVFLNQAAASQISLGSAEVVARTQEKSAGLFANSASKTITPGAPNMYTAEGLADLRGVAASAKSELLRLVSVLSWVLLAITSLSAGIAAYLSVNSRTGEIALRRALGESRRSVRTGFVLEGLIVGVFGGALGAAIAYFVLQIITAVLGWESVVSPGVFALGIIAGAGTGMLASIYPAAVAAKMDPAQAFRV